MDKKTILFLFGGCSSEHSVSLQSAHGVLTHLDRSRWLPLMVGITPAGQWLCYTGPVERLADGSWSDDPKLCTPCVLSPDRDRRQLLLLGAQLSRITIDIAFPILHGKNGEDGTVQGLLELAGVPVIGCDTLSSALCMDKDRAHKLAQLAGVSVPKGMVFSRGAALRYGFVERYPAGKDAVTGIAHEPWHFRYVGAPHAQRMAELGLCLEEYLELLRSEEQRFILDNDRSVRVSHIPCAGTVTAADLPGGCCQISGDNVDGFIVTAWGGRA